jgi:hypothetical protein
MRSGRRSTKIVERDKTYYGGSSMPRRNKQIPFSRKPKRLLDLTVMEKDENASLSTFIRRAKKFGTKFAVNSYFEEDKEEKTNGELTSTLTNGDHLPPLEGRHTL